MINKILGVFLGLSCFLGQAQEEATPKKYDLDFNYFYGNIVEHNKDIGHLITGHPQGFIFSYNQKTFGEKEWQRHFNFPDLGASLIYQDMANPNLGDHIGIYAHYNFYFLNRYFLLRVGQGVSYNTDPYDLDTNYENIAYGTHLLASTYLLLNFSKKNLFKGFGVQGGINLIHYSNGNFKAPNTRTNTFSINLGLNYQLDHNEEFHYQTERSIKNYSEPIHLNFTLKGGVQTSDVIGMDQFPFYILGTYLDKRVSYKSSVHLGSEVFLSPMLEELIYYRSIAYPEDGLQGDESSTRVGVFAGYQLHLGKTSIFGNLGYYVYYPYDFEGRTYLRAGIQRDLFKNFFGSLSVKSHAAKAEAMEFGIGYRL